MKNGWIALSRDLQENPIFKQKRVYSRWEAWIDILYTVNYSDNKVLFENTFIECKKGQSLLSLESWGKRWGWNKSAVRRFLELLKSETMIEIENVIKTTRITVLLSDSYDDSRNASETDLKRIRNASETHLKPIEEREQRKKEIKKEKQFSNENFSSNKKVREGSLYGDGELDYLCVEFYKQNENKYPAEMYKEFLSYWTAPVRIGNKNDIGKELWRTNKTFQVAGRLSTWYQNSLKRNVVSIQPTYDKSKSVFG